VPLEARFYNFQAPTATVSAQKTTQSNDGSHASEQLQSTCACEQL